MAVTAVASTPSVLSPVAALGTSSSTSGVTADLTNFTHARSAGNKSSADAALVQLRSDLASEQTAMLSAMMGSADGTAAPSAADTGSSLLSSVFGLGSSANSSAALRSVGSLATQSASSGSASISLYA